MLDFSASLAQAGIVTKGEKNNLSFRMQKKNDHIISSIQVEVANERDQQCSKINLNLPIKFETRVTLSSPLPSKA